MQLDWNMRTKTHLKLHYGSLYVARAKRPLYVLTTKTGRVVTKQPTAEQRKYEHTKIERMRCWCAECQRKFTTTLAALEIPGRGKMKGCERCQKTYVKAFDTVWPSMRSLATAFGTKDVVLTRRVRDENLTLEQAIEKPHLKPIEPGDHFHRLTVQAKGPEQLTWECLCRCGKTVAVRSCNLYSGNTKSCGCRRADSNRKNGERRKKYTKAEYTIGKYTHTSMMQRCYNPRHKSYSDYGARGVRVYKPWHKRETFLKELCALIGPRPKGAELDRVDNDGHYEPGNLRWSTKSQNASNRRSAVFLTYKGKKRTIAEWARRKSVRKLGLNEFKLYYRKSRRWSDKKILTTPAGERG